MLVAAEHFKALIAEEERQKKEGQQLQDKKDAANREKRKAKAKKKKGKGKVQQKTVYEGQAEAAFTSQSAASVAQKQSAEVLVLETSLETVAAKPPMTLSTAQKLFVFPVLLEAYCSPSPLLSSQSCHSLSLLP